MNITWKNIIWNQFGAAIDMLCLRPAMGARRFVDEIHVTRNQGIPGERWLSQPWLQIPQLAWWRMMRPWSPR